MTVLKRPVVFHRKDLKPGLWFGGEISGKNLQRFTSSSWVPQVYSLGHTMTLVPNQIFFGIQAFTSLTLFILSVLVTLHFPPGSKLREIKIHYRNWKRGAGIPPLSLFKYEIRLENQKKENGKRKSPRFLFGLRGFEHPTTERIIFPLVSFSIDLSR